MSGSERLNFDAQFCPKRVWVLSVLADDEALNDPHELPRGLAFHLSRCPSCRTIAEGLTRVSASLDDLGGVGVPDGLLDAANVQARAALQSGGRPTGRVRIPDDIDPPFADEKPPRRRWVVGARYAAAAAVVLAVGTLGVSTFRGRGGWFPVNDRAAVDYASPSRTAPEMASPDPVDESDGRLAAGVGEHTPLGPVSEDAPDSSPADFTDAADRFGESPAVTVSGRRLARRRSRPETPAFHHQRRVRRPGAPWCSDPGCAPTAVVLPGGARRMMQSAPAPIDRHP